MEITVLLLVLLLAQISIGVYLLIQHIGKMANNIHERLHRIEKLLTDREKGGFV